MPGTGPTPKPEHSEGTEEVDALESPEGARLAEFSALRAEVQRRSTTQQALVGLNLTVLAAVAGAVASSDVGADFLLVLPLVSSVLGLFWLDHARNIELIGSYIANELWHWEPSWESYGRNLNTRMSWRVLEFGLPVSLVFVGGSVAALVLTVVEGLGGRGAYVLWALGLALVTAYLAAWLPFLTKQRRGPRDVTETR